MLQTVNACAPVTPERGLLADAEAGRAINSEVGEALFMPSIEAQTAELYSHMLNAGTTKRCLYFAAVGYDSMLNWSAVALSSH